VKDDFDLKLKNQASCAVQAQSYFVPSRVFSAALMDHLLKNPLCYSIFGKLEFLFDNFLLRITFPVGQLVPFLMQI
jgi:hypothetical protein